MRRSNALNCEAMLNIAQPIRKWNDFTFGAAS